LGKVRSYGVRLIRKASLYFAVRILLSLIFFANAVLIQSVVTSPIQSVTGGALSVNTNLSSADRGFSKAASTMAAAGASSCAGNVTFLVLAQSANNAITSGDIVYDVQLNTTGTTPSSTCYTVTLANTSSGGSPQTYRLYVATGLVVASGESIDCKFDIGSTIPASPFSFSLKTSP
jgi:hypothetical protein